MNVVVETNVPIAANGRDTHASFACQYTCIEFLKELVSPESAKSIILDEQGLIIEEYRSYLNHRGQPGVGDIFFKYLHDHMYLGEKIILLPITPIVDESRGFEELPVNQIDKSDRKFLALAIVANANITNALDTDWHEQTVFIDSMRIQIDQLCPEHGCRVVEVA